MSKGPPWHSAWSPHLSLSLPHHFLGLPSSYPTMTDPTHGGRSHEALPEPGGTGSPPHPPTQVHSEYLESPGFGGGRQRASWGGQKASCYVCAAPHSSPWPRVPVFTGQKGLLGLRVSTRIWGSSEKKSLTTPRAPAAVPHCSILGREKEYGFHTHVQGME